MGTGHKEKRSTAPSSKGIYRPSISHEAQLDFLFCTSRLPRSFKQAVSRIRLANRLLAPFRASFNHHVHYQASRASRTRLAYPKTTRPSSLTTSASLAICGRGACEVGGGRGLGRRASWRASGSLSSISIIFMANASTSVPRDHLAGSFADVGLARKLWQGAERGRRRQGAWLACVSAREQLFLIIILNPMQAQARPETTRLGPLPTSISLAICGRGACEVGGGRGLGRRAFWRASADALLEPLQQVSRTTSSASASLALRRGADTSPSVQQASPLLLPFSVPCSQKTKNQACCFRSRYCAGSIAVLSARLVLFPLVLFPFPSASHTAMQALAYPETTRLGFLLTSASLAICGRGASEVG